MCYFMSHAVIIIIFSNRMRSLFSFDDFSLNGRLSRNPTVSLNEKFLWYKFLKYCNTSTQSQNGNLDKTSVANNGSVIRIRGNQIM
jgi:hypothetical protein